MSADLLFLLVLLTCLGVVTFLAILTEAIANRVYGPERKPWTPGE